MFDFGANQLLLIRLMYLHKLCNNSHKGLHNLIFRAMEENTLRFHWFDEVGKILKYVGLSPEYKQVNGISINLWKNLINFNTNNYYMLGYYNQVNPVIRDLNIVHVHRNSSVFKFINR